jgi:hypothetical protein
MAEAAAATTEETAETTETEVTTETTVETDAELKPEGEKALNAFKARARAAEKAQKELADKLDKIEEANKSETDKALDKARKEARAEAEGEFEKERRSDRLQVAVAKHARDLADVDDVVLNLAQGDLDALFDKDGKIDAKAVQAALEALLKDKPHLKATGVGKPQGSADGGEGQPGEGNSFNDQLRRAAGH